MAEEGKQPKQKTPRIAKKDYYTITDGKLVRKRKHCPKCGPGVFMAEHENRISCGRCGYTEFKKR